MPDIRKTDKKPDAYDTAARCWQECRTLRELGDDRPPIMGWFRHLAFFPHKSPDAPEPSP